jgi:hypothetical protein
MDKQDAIDFIVQEYENGLSPTDIASALSKKLNAPLEIVQRFVQKTLEQRLALVNTLTEAPIPPTGLNPTLPETEPIQQTTEEKSGAEARLASPAPYTGLPHNPPEALVSHTDSLAAYAEDPHLQNLVLKELGKNAKQSDVIMKVCEQTGLDWREAQRLAARIAAQHRRKIMARQNMVIIPLSLMALLAGLLLTIAGAEELFAFGNALLGLQVGQNPSGALPTQEFMRSAPWAVATGLSLILGGVAGLANVIKRQLE